MQAINQSAIDVLLEYSLLTTVIYTRKRSRPLTPINPTNSLRTSGSGHSTPLLLMNNSSFRTPKDKSFHSILPILLNKDKVCKIAIYSFNIFLISRIIYICIYILLLIFLKYYLFYNQIID